MSGRNEGLTERLAAAAVGVALVSRALAPRPCQRFRTARLASAGCGLGLLAVATAASVLGLGLLLISVRAIRWLLGLRERGRW